MSDTSARLPDTLPPHNIEAEESILGGILLDPEAIARVADTLSPDAFYVPAHQAVYEAAIALFAQNKPADLMNVTAWLQDRNLLAGVGGASKLAQLVERTVSAVNVDGYGSLVTDKHLRRQLIGAGRAIADLGYDTALELPAVLDRAEQTIFQLTQARQLLGLVPIAETLVQTFNDLEDLNQSDQLPGIDSGFYDLDAMTSGFQRSDLVVIAGRPSMGKTALALNIARNVAGTHQLPVAVFSLEMSKEQLAQRLLASEARIDSNRLRSGRLAQQDFEPLSAAIARLSEMPIFIDDTANASVMQMRSLSRRLQAEQGELGLILVDYLQLMEGSGSDNRVQELARITRGLKTLARELKVPVIALSQLSRGVEQRSNKRPMLADLRESGSIEQDADLVIMLYRDSYYHPDSPDRDIAEAIITKHRNGPTGTIKLLFSPELTQFRNMLAKQPAY
ncbi:replicative DNA helicase [Rubidibacter lacunae KORDI 51-2]|uniref:Replicative DNA helicase n=1 Tax=Rubidibacter lacunae KORDI 51-2 TaxID=582515 RepID=U5DMJ1_9CHRO|nr:replicative DNA helicase [Rubidibacter lacunae]ERN42891.1 replicative DNA helicase [Rubidibacter lacunae KORDI 51-2]